MRGTLLLTGRRWWTLLLALALATRLLSPEGWMPAAGGGVMLCPGAGAPMAMGHHRHDAPVHAADHGCPFAQAATTAPPPAPLAWTAPAPPPSTLPVRRLVPAVGRGLAAPPPPATGPPAFA